MSKGMQIKVLVLLHLKTVVKIFSFTILKFKMVAATQP